MAGKGPALVGLGVFGVFFSNVFVITLEEFYVLLIGCVLPSEHK